MCGIAGVALTNSNTAFSRDWLGDIAQALKHRGPDDIGFFGYHPTEKPVLTRDYKTLSNAIRLALVHRRLSIIDTQHGWQPMMDSTSRYVITYNGELYNYIELRKILQSYGHSFNTQSDTEVLLTAYIHWGKNCLQHLMGMFSFAIFDVMTNTIFLARDHFGIKPLYYINKTGIFAFASEIKALLTIPIIERRLNLKTAHEYLTTGMTDKNEETFFQDIYQLPPAHYMQIDLEAPEKINPVKYWAPLKTTSSLSFLEASEAISELFLDSVKLHMRSDVPIGATLSGGMDSSAVVLAMHRYQNNVPIPTFSYLAEEQKINEEKWIDLLGDVAQLETHKLQINSSQILDDIDDLIYSLDEPFGSTSILAQRHVFKRVAEVGIKVTLDGQGADEVFAGYPLYLSARLQSLFKNRQYTQIYSFLRHVTQKNNLSKRNIILRMLKMMLPANIVQPLTSFIGHNSAVFLKSNAMLFRTKTNADRIRPSTIENVLFNSLETTMSSTILPALLRYIDRNSMRFSVESRVPFLSRKLVDFVYSLPEEYLISPQGETKSVLRQGMHSLVPAEICNRKDKISFQTPEAAWLRILGGWATDMMHRSKVKELDFLNQKALAKAIKFSTNTTLPNALHARTLWRYINFVRWAEIYEVAY